MKEVAVDLFPQKTPASAALSPRQSGEHLADRSVDSLLAALDESFGPWDEQDFDGRAWVDRARGGLDRSIGATAWE